MEHYKITWKNFKIWFMDQVKRKTWFRNFFITRNAWGAFSINSHINQHTGQPKITYNHVESALKAADKMSKKNNTHFSIYKCLYCDGYHIGKNRDNKTDYDKINRIDFSKNIQLHTKVQNKPDEWRLGQAYFNYAEELYPEETNQLRGTEYDCFHSDEKIPEFLKKLNELLLKIK